VTILINNAGIVAGKPLLEVSDFMIEKTMQVNALGIIWTIREFLPAMMAKNKGHIVNISSVASMCGTPHLTEYCGSKGAATLIDECVRMEMKKYGKNIKTTCICP
jgi:all-trans-retinol dehydrogenase (NAD+)